MKRKDGPVLFEEPTPEPTPISTPEPDEPPPTEAELAAEAARYPAVLDWLRPRLVLIYHFRVLDVTHDHAFVTVADAIRRLMKCPHGVPRNPAFLALVFQAEWWRGVGSGTGGTPEKRLMRWVYDGPLSQTPEDFYARPVVDPAG